MPLKNIATSRKLSNSLIFFSQFRMLLHNNNYYCSQTSNTWHSVYTIVSINGIIKLPQVIILLTLGRLGGWVPPPWRFSPITFLMIPTGKIALVYLLLGIEDTFWYMWHHLDAVTWHMSWRQQSMTIDENTVVLPLYVCHDIFWSTCDRAKSLVLFLTFSR